MNARIDSNASAMRDAASAAMRAFAEAFGTPNVPAPLPAMQSGAGAHSLAPGFALGFAPGRVNLIGDHTDYNGGLVLPAILREGTYVALRARTDGVVRLCTTRGDQRFSGEISTAPQGDDWHHYVLGVAALASSSGYRLGGFDAAIHGTLPVASGLSSSASLEVVVLLALEAAHGFAVEPAEAARLCQRVEHEVVGVRCGIMDQMVVRVGRAGYGLLLDCATEVYEHVPLRTGACSFFVVDTGTPRTLAGAAYNERREACEEAAQMLRESAALQFSGDTLSDLRAEQLPEALPLLPERLAKCVRHVVTENGRVRRLAAALRASDVDQIGVLMNASHASLAQDYEVSSRALDRYQSAALAAGALGARMTGAGFGGCLVALGPPEVRASLLPSHPAPTSVLSVP